MSGPTGAGPAQEHIPVLLESVLKYTEPKPGECVIDCTFGYGGYAKRFLKAISPDGKLLGIDQDPTAIEDAKPLVKEYPGRLQLTHGIFADLKTLAKGFPAPAIIVADLGVSSPMLDNPERGFSFLHDGPLDMRMNTQAGETAAEFINTHSQAELTEILKKYGEEPHAHAIAQAIVEKRKSTPFKNTFGLVDVIEATYRRILHAPPDRRIWLKRGLHPATQTFQALRIAVNNELDQLEKLLPAAFDLLAPTGRLAVVSFHSLEDRIVKRFIQDYVRSCVCPPEQLQCSCSRRPRAKAITKKPIIPSDEEVSSNPRSRSAKLRVLEKNFS